jgi:CheY-like chemotaxis protein
MQNLQPAPETRKILIIDDEGDTCFLLSNILKGQNVEIEQVNTLSQAEVFIREEEPSLLFLDNKLPDGGLSRNEDHSHYGKRQFRRQKESDQSWGRWFSCQAIYRAPGS